MPTPEELQAQLDAKQKELDATKSKMAELEAELEKAKGQNEFFDKKFKDMGNELGDLRKTAKARSETIEELKEKISGQAGGPASPPPPEPEPAPVQPSTEELASENDALQTRITEEGQALLDEMYEHADTETQKLIEDDEEARNEFLKQALPPEETGRGWRRDPKRTKSGEAQPDARERIRNLFSNAKKGALTPTGPQGGAHDTRSRTRTGQPFRREPSPTGHVSGAKYLDSLKLQRRQPVAVE